jgi:hypothetical protein
MKLFQLQLLSYCSRRSIIEAVMTRPTLLWMQRLLYTAAVLVFITGFQLYVLTEYTDTFFAWTIAPPNNVYLTAAFLGASYWASAVLEYFGGLNTRWTHARIAVPSVLVFTIITSVITFIHFDRFHFTPPSLPFTILMTVVWLIVYITVPVIMLILLIQQVRKTSAVAKPEKSAPAWLNTLLIIQGIVMIMSGIALLFFPSTAAAFWPWKLTPLTANAIGAWLVGLSVAAFQAVWENDMKRLRPAYASYTILGLLQLVAVARYHDELDWSSPRTWLYLVFLLSILLSGLIAWIKSK